MQCHMIRYDIEYLMCSKSCHVASLVHRTIGITSCKVKYELFCYYINQFVISYKFRCVLCALHINALWFLTVMCMLCNTHLNLSFMTNDKRFCKVRNDNSEQLIVMMMMTMMTTMIITTVATTRLESANFHQGQNINKKLSGISRLIHIRISMAAKMQ